MSLHVLLHMADAEEPMRSEEIAGPMRTNAAAMRRTMGGLRRAGIVRSEKGHGGGWTLVKPLAEVSLWDVYAALGEPTIFAIGNRTESPGCLVEQAVNQAMGSAFEDAEALLVARFKRVSLATLHAKTRGRMREWRQSESAKAPKNTKTNHPKVRA